MCLIIIPHMFDFFFEALIGHTRSDSAHPSVKTVFLECLSQLEAGGGHGNEPIYGG